MRYSDFFDRVDEDSNEIDIPSLKYKKERKRMLESTRKLKKKILNEKKLRIFDLDDTLVKTNSKIYVERGDGERLELTPAEFAVYEPEGREKFDFSDFGKLIEPENIKKYNKIFKNMVNASGKRKVTILTARGSKKPVEEYLKMVGVEGRVNIVALSNNDPQAKKRYVRMMMKERGYDDVFFIDDSVKNVKAIESLKKEFPNAKIKSIRAKI